MNIHSEHFKELFHKSTELYCEYLKTNDLELCEKASTYLASAAGSIRSIVEISFRHFEFKKYKEIYGVDNNKDNDRDEDYSVRTYYENDAQFNQHRTNWFSKYKDVIESFRQCTRLSKDMFFVIKTSNYSKHISLDVLESVKGENVEIGSEDIVLAGGHLVLEVEELPDGMTPHLWVDGTGLSTQSIKSPNITPTYPTNAYAVVYGCAVSSRTVYYVWQFPNGESNYAYFGLRTGMQAEGQSMRLYINDSNMPVEKFPEQPFYGEKFGGFFYEDELVIPVVTIDSSPYSAYTSIWSAYEDAMVFSKIAFDAL